VAVACRAVATSETCSPLSQIPCGGKLVNSKPVWR
jgi:hypothetical protein